MKKYSLFILSSLLLILIGCENQNTEFSVLNSPVIHNVDPIGPYIVKDFKKVNSSDLVWVILGNDKKSVIGALSGPDHNLSKGQKDVFVNKVTFNTFNLGSFDDVYIIIKKEN